LEKNPQVGGTRLSIREGGKERKKSRETSCQRRGGVALGGGIFKGRRVKGGRGKSLWKKEGSRAKENSLTGKWGIGKSPEALLLHSKRGGKKILKEERVSFAFINFH